MKKSLVLKSPRVEEGASVKVLLVKKLPLSSQGYLIEDGYSDKGLREDDAEVIQYL